MNAPSPIEVTAAGIVMVVISVLLKALFPIDFIPDAIPGAGHLDDATVLLICLRAGAKDDIKDYEKWREKNKKNIEK